MSPLTLSHSRFEINMWRTRRSAFATPALEPVYGVPEYVCRCFPCGCDHNARPCNLRAPHSPLRLAPRSHHQVASVEDKRPLCQSSSKRLEDNWHSGLLSSTSFSVQPPHARRTPRYLL